MANNHLPVTVFRDGTFIWWEEVPMTMEEFMKALNTLDIVDDDLIEDDKFFDDLEEDYEE